MTQERSLQATVREPLSKWLHCVQCKHKVYDPPDNSKVTKQLCVSEIRRRSSNPEMDSAGAFCLNRKIPS